jgi:oligoribonuclease NrnB/cAMP/cGMP phosphodiesterase (DHH superfamily)
MNSKTLIIYHSEDNDGRVSGALCRISTETNFPNEEVICHGYTYAQLSELVKQHKSSVDFAKRLHSEYDKIIMTDISFNETDVMKSLYNEFGKKFYWFDHHAPAVKSSFDNGYDNASGFRVAGTCSAIKCVWEYLFNGLYSDADNERIPKILNILSAYDSWNWENHGTTFDFCNCVNKGFNVESESNFEKTYEIIVTLLNNLNKYAVNAPSIHEQQLLMNCYTTGKILIESDKISNKDLIEKWGDCSFVLDNGDKCCVLFNQSIVNSISFESLKTTSIKHGVVLKRIPYSGNYVISLYNVNSDDEFNCGKYLKLKYKGGGHKGAGGATISNSQINKILKSKIV